MKHTHPWLCVFVLLCVPAHVAAGQQAATQPTDAPMVTLLDPGTAPRQALRLTPQIGSEQTMDMTMRMSMTQSIGDMAMPEMKLPGMRFTMLSKVVQVKENGDVQFEFTCTNADIVDEPGVAASMADAMRTSLKGAVGLRGTGLMSSRGFTKEADFEMPGGIDPMAVQHLESLKQAVKQLGAPLPKEPVGVGAEWRVDQTITMNGMMIKQTSTFKLTKIEGDRLQLDVKVKQTADAQTISPPGAVAGTTVNLNSLTSEGSGKMVLMLTQLMPINSQMNVTSDSSMSIDAQGRKQDMSQHMEMSVEMETREPPPD
ncbi:MAG: hypothetical protein IH889_02975 [Planctomycetes bacterium]|nr:hypothetical protein [Planctomycetota bacterium]